MPAASTRAALGWFVLTSALLILLFRDAAERAVRMWIDTPTYSYAFLMVPLSIYLIVQRASQGPLPHVSPWPVLLLLHLPIGAVWYLAVVAEIVEIQQFCLLAAVYVTIVALFGLRLVYAHLVALLLLGFMVPSGQFLVPPLQWLSAEMSAGMLRVVGAPMFLDGLYIQMPQASYHVEPGCAGLNFVLVTIVLALVVGELFYTSLAKKVAVMAALLGVALVANPLRIFAIIYIDWLTDRTTDIVSDHLAYGWAFFAAILAIVLPIALQYRDDTGAPASSTPVDNSTRAPGLNRKLALTGIVGIVLAALAPLAVLALDMNAARAVAMLPALPGTIDRLKVETQGPWQVTAAGMAHAKAEYAAEEGAPIAVDVTLRLAPTPRVRLVDRWQPLTINPAPTFLGMAETAGGRAALYQSGGITDKRLWLTCFLVGGRCYPDAGAHRRAVLASLARDPLARAGFVVMSQPGGVNVTGSARPDHYDAMLAAMDQLVAAIKAGRGK